MRFQWAVLALLLPLVLSGCAVSGLTSLVAASDGPAVATPEPFPTPKPMPTATITPTPTTTRTPPPTETPTPRPPTDTPPPSPTPTETVDPATLPTPTLPPIPRPRGPRGSYNAADLLAPESLPATLGGVHFAGGEALADELFGARSAWVVDVVYTSDLVWVQKTADRLRDLHERGFRVILRVDYARGQHIPPVDDRVEVLRYAQAFVTLHTRAGRWVKYFVVGNEGNLDSDERTECRAGRHTCTPEAYVEVYRAVRERLREKTDAYTIVAAPSPGRASASDRWVNGRAYLADVLGRLHPAEVDGIALHAYGDSADGIAAQLTTQIAAVRAASYTSTPLFVTEVGPRSGPNADAIAGAYAWIDDHNRRSRLDIVAAAWFVYHNQNGDWEGLDLEGRPALLDALATAGGYAPGR